MVARAVGGSLAILSLELIKSPALLLEGGWSSSSWVVSGWWRLRREHHHLFFKHANHWPASWKGESTKHMNESSLWPVSVGNRATCQPILQQLLTTSPCPQTVCDLSFLMPQRPGARLAFSSSFFHSFTTHCIGTDDLCQKPKKSNNKLQCASYLLAPSASLKKKEGCHHFGNLTKHSANLGDSSFWWQHTVFKHWWFI